ncbi:MAG: DUF4112 domain-containing protein [Longimicrobiales bacterium]
MHEGAAIAQHRPRDSEVERLRGIARWLDELVRIPGTRIRFGLDALIGLIPGAGDLVTGCVSAWTMLAATRAGAPPSVIARMAGNIVLDLVVGTVPLLGDLFDIGWKANVRNVALLEQFAANPARVRAGSRVLLALALFAIAALLLAAAWLATEIVRRLVSLL